LTPRKGQSGDGGTADARPLMGGRASGRDTSTAATPPEGCGVLGSSPSSLDQLSGHVVEGPRFYGPLTQAQRQAIGRWLHELERSGRYRRALALLALALLTVACVLNPPPNPGPTPPTTTTTTTTTQPPAPELPMGCHAPQGQWIGPGPVITTHAPEVAAVMAHLTGCEPGSDCPHGEGPGHEGAQRWMRRVNACLRDPACLSKACRSASLLPQRCAPVRGGLCAGFHVDGHTDEISVDCREGYHVANVGGGKVVWPPPWGGAARESWTPEGGCPPAPRPTPTPGPPSFCPLPWGPGRWVESVVENIGRPPDSQRISVETKWCSDVDDRDPNTGRMAPPGWPFECGTKCCRISSHEKDLGEVCQAALYGTPTWTAQGTVRIVEQANPFNLKIAEGAGRVSVCGSVPGSDGALPCSTALVVAQVGPVVGP
jgi:hypothetical protein